MAVVTPGMPGELAGRLGNVIYYTVNGQLRARKKPGSVKNPRTPKQTAQRMRVKGIGALFRSLDIPLRCVWNRLAEGLPKSGVEPAGGGLAEKRVQCVHEQEYPFAERGGADCQPGAIPRDGRRAADTGVGDGGMDGGRADGYHLGHDGGRRNQ